MSVIDFTELEINKLAKYLKQHLCLPEGLHSISSTLDALKQQWQQLQYSLYPEVNYASASPVKSNEVDQVDWLIALFNAVFSTKNVTLVRGEYEPEYFPATCHSPARIEFAHGFFQSALHEISHWSLAGTYRRTLPDFGYWYVTDGRDEAQQNAFEQVEIKPQAIECLLSLMCGRSFRVSQDNLNANFDTSQSTFEQDVFNQVKLYINDPQKLPSDAKTLLTALAFICHDII